MTENPAPPSLPARGHTRTVKILIGLLVLALILGGLWWWYNRPIQPVQLSVQEKAAVEALLEIAITRTLSRAAAESEACAL